MAEEIAMKLKCFREVIEYTVDNLEYNSSQNN